jgi:hypothetical protein
VLVIVKGGSFPVPVKKYQYAPAAMRSVNMRMSAVLDFIEIKTI